MITAAVAILLAATAIPASAATIVLTSGHVDVVDVNYSGGTLSVQLLDGTVERSPAGVELHVLAAAKTTVPTNPAYSFLGAPGSTVWILPQTQRSGLLWPGWNATDVPSGVFSGSLSFSLVSVSGGNLAIYTSSLAGPTVLFNSANGLPDTNALSAGAHAHANWAFNTATTYTVTFRVSGTLLSTGAVVSDEKSYTFKVIP
jgi:surface-anchored protein